MTENNNKNTIPVGDDNQKHEAPNNPLDAAMNTLVHAEFDGVGPAPLALQLTNQEGDRQILIGRMLPEIDEYEGPSPLRSHLIKSTDSFIEYCARYGDPKASLVMYDVDGFVLVVDEKEIRYHDDCVIAAAGLREMIGYALTPHEDYLAWEIAITAHKYMTHRELATLLQTQGHNLLEGEVLTALESIAYNVTINHESAVSNDGATQSVSLSSTTGEKTARFPKAFKITLPVLEEDTEETWDGEVRLIIKHPEKSDEKLAFKLVSPMFKMALRQRAQHEADHVSATLGDGWTVYNGKVRYAEWAAGDRRPTRYK